MSKMLRMSEQDLQRILSRGMSCSPPVNKNEPKPAQGLPSKADRAAPDRSRGGTDAPAHKQKGSLVSKYRAVRTTVNGITFASKAEAKRYHELKILEAAGQIYQMELQPKFVLADAVTINGRKRPPLRYMADFTYWTKSGHFQVVEDVKGMLTPVYKLKRHLMKSQLGLDIVEITK